MSNSCHKSERQESSEDAFVSSYSPKSVGSVTTSSTGAQDHDGGKVAKRECLTRDCVKSICSSICSVLPAGAGSQPRANPKDTQQKGLCGLLLSLVQPVDRTEVLY